MIFSLVTVCWLPLIAADVGQAPGAVVVEAYGYKGCVLLENATTRVVLEPNCGGRVIEYALKGVNAIYVDPEQNGRVYDGTESFGPCGGRCDIGPEMIVPRRPALWLGRWTATITGPRKARLTSVKDDATGVQLVRDFELAEKGSRLRFTQTIRNVSNETKHYCHWSRTFAVGGGIVVIPLTEPSRFPRHYVNYGPGPAINCRPEDPNVRQRDGFIEILGRTERRKLGFDSKAGWFAYVAPNDVMFVKRYRVWPDRVYNEVAGLTISIWYYLEPDKQMCELEPIGPQERLAPGQEASFTEEWWLLPYTYPRDKKPLDLKALAALVDEKTKN